MKYWDTSCLASLLINEVHTGFAERVFREDEQVVTWWGTGVECVSAIWNNERRGVISTEEAAVAQKRLLIIQKRWIEVEPNEAIRESAARFLRLHDLRAADAFQLAAASEFSGQRTEELPFVSTDKRLIFAARCEGFTIVTTKELS